MNIWDILILLSIVGVAVYTFFISRRKSGCHGNCGCCDACSGCGEKAEKNKSK